MSDMNLVRFANMSSNGTDSDEGDGEENDEYEEEEAVYVQVDDDADDVDNSSLSLRPKVQQFHWLGADQVNVTRKLHHIILEMKKKAYFNPVEQMTHEEYENVLFEHFKLLFEQAVSEHLSHGGVGGGRRCQHD